MAKAKTERRPAVVRRIVLTQLLPPVVLAIVWLTLTGHSQQAFERWSIVLTATLLTIAYAGFSIAYIWANKTRLNTAIALNKFDLFCFFGLLTLPVLWGIALRAPYDLPKNPWALFIVPPVVRTWVYWRVSISSVGAALEFFRANRWFRAFPPGTR